MEGNTKKVAIIGYGFVGKATEFFLDRFFPGTEIQIHDPAQGEEIENWKGIQYAFTCVPTNLKDGKLDASIIDKVLNDLTKRSCADTVIPVIRSTIGPDQATIFVRKYGAIIMPEFLREKHWKEDVLDSKTPLLIGAIPNAHQDFLLWMGESFTAGTLKQRFITSPGVASTIKIYRNAFLAINVGLANDIKGVCDIYDLDYRDVQDFFMSDKTLGNHWQVPGPDGKYGFGGTCLPKDLTHASSLCYNENNIMKTALEANKSRRDDE